MISNAFRSAIACAVASVIGLVGPAQMASAQNATRSERYEPAIWVDPDGCQHWVMDDGAEGFMSPVLTRQGLPVCMDLNLCGTINSDQLFATDSYRINAAGRARLQQFFSSSAARAFVIVGHTDSRASDAYNMKLSYNRANAVAKVGASTGVQIVDVRGYGERMPKASNSTAAGMQQNRRVEIMCFQ
ncbi:MAG: OmpA family protein [Thalassovita sp.]